MSRFQSRCLALVWVGFSCTLYAVDGVVLIDQNRALAGNVTPGDAAGFPVTISVSGSYRLSGNLTVPDVNTSAIAVIANGVTIDLNGFSIIGPAVCTPSCDQTGSGIGIAGGTPIPPAIGVANLTVVNGTIRGMGGNGISVFGQSAYIEKVHVYSNGGNGMDIGNFSIATGNTALSNGGTGIFARTSTVIGNTAVANGGSGIFAFCPSTVTGNTATVNPAGNIGTTGANCALANNAAP